MSRLKLTVKELKELLNTVPDDYPVVIPVVDSENADCFYGFRHIRKMGILHCNLEYDDPNVFYLGTATSTGNKTIRQQLDESGYEHVEAKEMETYEIKINY